MGGTHAPRVVAASLGERCGPLLEQTAPGAASHEPEGVRELGDTRCAGDRISATQRMICVTVEVREGPVTRRVRITGPSIRRALALVGGGKPDREVRLVFPIDLDTFFASGGLSRQASMVAEARRFTPTSGAVTWSASETIRGILR